MRYLCTLCPWALLVLALGCDSAVELPASELAAGTAGADGEGFIPVDDGTEVELIPGSQGGFHVWLGIRVHGVTGKVYLEREARRLHDDVLVFRGIPRAVDIPAEAMDEWWQPDAATPAFMCPSPIGVQVHDQELVFDVSLTDEQGAVLATDQLILLPRCPEDADDAAFCYQICAG